MASPLSTSDNVSSVESSTSSMNSTAEFLVEKLDTVVSKIAENRNLEKSVVLDRIPPIDVCIFGRSGIGKSELLKALTSLDIRSSGQLDHVTQALTHVSKTIGSFTFRFWDTKGIDNWMDIEMIDHMFNEMKELNVRPIFVIYCAASGGRVDSDIVAGILKRFQMENTLICYVITNMYGGSSDQLDQQIQGGLTIMNHVFDQKMSIEKDKYSYIYSDNQNRNDTSVAKKPGIVIAVNSCTFRHVMGMLPEKNITELMEFLAGHLEDEDFIRFVALTINNRSFWTRASDALRTRLERVKKGWTRLKDQFLTFFKRHFD